MENVEENNPILLSESEVVKNDMEVKTELNELDQNCNEASLNLEEKEESKKPGLFAPFNHSMKPDFEYINLELEKRRSSEAETKIINDRYKLIMENAAKHKPKEEKKMTFTPISHSVDIDAIIKTTELLFNFHMTSTSTKDQLKETLDSYQGNSYWYDSVNEFNNLNDNEIENEQKDGEKGVFSTQMSHERDTAKYMNDILPFSDESDTSSCDDEYLELPFGIGKD